VFLYSVDSDESNDATRFNIANTGDVGSIAVRGHICKSNEPVNNGCSNNIKNCLRSPISSNTTGLDNNAPTALFNASITTGAFYGKHEIVSIIIQTHQLYHSSIHAMHQIEINVVYLWQCRDAIVLQ